MMIRKNNGQICEKCGSFSKKFIICDHCHRKLCLQCVMTDSQCFECYMLRGHEIEVNEYFNDKYAKGVKI